MSHASRKFQICNGYLLEFEQLARVLQALGRHEDKGKVSRDDLVEETGLAKRQVESLVSVAAAMGLLRPGSQKLTPEGRIICEHDVFIEARGTLEWCHYAGAGNHRNLIWYELFNSILPKETAMPLEDLTSYLRTMLAEKYTENTLKKHLREEVRFVADAYLVRNFRRIGVLHQATDGRLYQRRTTELIPEVLAAMIYDFGRRMLAEVIQIEELLTHAGSPGVLFALERQVLREMVEILHRKGWVHYEFTHNLDQVRLGKECASSTFLTSYYEKGGE
jgi:hypothetical protein